MSARIWTACRRCPRRRREGERILVLFLGSTIGNFDRPAGDQFLREVRAILHAGDSLLLATDLEKPVAQLLLAYDDPAGVTAAFNMNLLARINRDLGADFDLKQFRHLARYDESERRVEMHLVSKAWQRVTIREAGFRFYLREGETIWTESSHKYNPAGSDSNGSAHGLSLRAAVVRHGVGFRAELLLCCLIVTARRNLAASRTRLVGCGIFFRLMAKTKKKTVKKKGVATKSPAARAAARGSGAEGRKRSANSGSGIRARTQSGARRCDLAGFGRGLS